MPNKKLTDSEIVKACKNCLHLEVCLKHLINVFPDTSQEEINLVLMREGCCKNFIDKDLINRLQAENERLKAPTNDWLIKGISAEQLEQEKIQAWKAVAYTDFAESLKKDFDNPRIQKFGLDFVKFLKNLVDNRLKEMVGEQPLNDIKCIDCEYLELELPYAVCSKAYKGIVAPDDSCGKGKLKELVGDSDV